MENHAIRFLDVSLFKIADSLTLHFKGFGTRIDFSNETTKLYAREVESWVLERKPKRIVWDGDSYELDSFTLLIPRLYNLIGDLELIAFLRECDQERFRKSWSELDIPIAVYLCDASLDWKFLGVEALKATQAKEVVCFGGGPTVLLEFQNACANTNFTLFPVTRLSKDGVSTEESSILNFTHPNLEIIRLP